MENKKMSVDDIIKRWKEERAEESLKFKQFIASKEGIDLISKLNSKPIRKRVRV